MNTIETLEQLVDWIALNFNDPSAMIIKSKISEIIEHEKSNNI
jgi:hypothetical protein